MILSKVRQNSIFSCLC